MLLVWDENAWQDYLWRQAQDRRVLKRINLLLNDIQRDGNEDIGKPEALRHGFAGSGPGASLMSTASCTSWWTKRSGSPPAGTTTAEAARRRNKPSALFAA